MSISHVLRHVGQIAFLRYLDQPRGDLLKEGTARVLPELVISELRFLCLRSAVSN